MNIDPCPAERMKRSRLSHFGEEGSKFRDSEKRTEPISAQPKGRPRWPEEQAWTASMARPRASAAAFFRTSVSMERGDLAKETAKTSRKT